MIDRLEYSRHFFEKYSNIEFNEIPPSGSRVFPCGRTDRHDEVDSRFSKFCERDQKGEIESEFFHPMYVVALYTYKYMYLCMYTHTQTFLFRRLYFEYSRLFSSRQIS
jgi:hypothetical protein